MAKDYDVMIYMRHISLEVVIPEKHVWDFMAQFGKAFAIRDGHSGTTTIKSVDDYWDHPNGWHVRLTVWECDEDKFYEFLRNFCKEKSIVFKESQEEE